MSSFTKHFTRTAANTGLRCDLVLPDGVTASGDWLHVLSVDSDAFRKADRECKQQLFAWASEGSHSKEEQAAFYRDQELTLLASLIESWSFTEECTPQNKRHFLQEAPQIADFINKQSVRRQEFFPKPSANLETTPPASSS